MGHPLHSSQPTTPNQTGEHALPCQYSQQSQTGKLDAEPWRIINLCHDMLPFLAISRENNLEQLLVH